MKKRTKHTTGILCTIALVLLCIQPVLGQFVPEIRIENKAFMYYTQLDGFPLSIESNLVSFVVKKTGRLYVQKTVFPVTALPGDTVTFAIVIGNIGTAALANVQVIDTLPASFSLVRVNQGQVQGSIVSSTWSVVDAGSMDTLFIDARVMSSVSMGTTLTNTAHGTDSVGTNVTSSTTLTVATMPHFVVTKSATPKPVLAGDTLTYTIRYGNDGNAAGTGVRIYDAVPTGTQFVSATSNGIVASGVVLWDIGTLATGTFGTVQMKVRIPSRTQNGSQILNIGLLSADGGVSITSNQDIAAVRGIIPGHITLVPNPRLIIGNGIDKSLLTITVTDTLGQPVPDATPVTMITTAGKFTNGQKTIVLSTINGIASTSLISDIVSNYIATAITSATAGTVETGTVTDFVTIIFYPSAITGKVLDNRTGRAVDGAIAEVRTSNGQVVGSDTTTAGNSYLVPVARTDTFRTRVTAIDAFGSPTTSSAFVFVAVPGIGGIPPVSNGNSISGTLYDIATGNRSLTSGLLVSRFIPSGTLVDTTRTDQNGNYVFNNVLSGNQTIILTTQFDTARAIVNHLVEGEFIINANLGIMTARPNLLITKTASADTVLVGDSVQYVLRFQNSGNVVLTNVIIRDTIPASLSLVSISENAQRTGTVISSTISSLSVGAMDSIWVTVKLRSDLPNHLTIVNAASAESDQTPVQSVLRAIVTRVVVADRSCRVALSSTPSFVIGNGVQASVIEAFLSDTLGNPKPDGTPATFSTTQGFFSNGQNTIVVPTLNGRAIDSVRALIAGSSIDTSFATVSVNDPEICSTSNTIAVIFYPGAISGMVHNRQTNQPMENVLIQVYSSDNILVGSTRTKADGRYLVPVPKTDRYRVVLTMTNVFGETSIATMYVSVVVPGTGGNPPTIGNNQIKGSIYYLVSNHPVPVSGIKLLLNPIAANVSPKQGSSKIVASTASLDSTVTDSTGGYLFANISAGTYEIAISHPWIQGKDTVQNIGEGEVVVDVNLPIVLNASLTFSKLGPTQVTPFDTVLYTITANNSGTLSMTSTVIIDTLDTLMSFISASSSGTYEPASHRVVWNVGTLSTGSQVHYSVQVAFAGTLRTTFMVRNRASITSNEIIPISAQTFTRVYVPSMLQIWKTSSVSAAQPGDTVTYNIHVENAAGATTDSIRVSDALPAQVRFLAAAPQAHYDSSAHLLRWLIDSLEVGQQWQAVVKTIVRSDLPAGEVLYTNTADIAWDDSRTTSSADPRSHADVTTIVSYLQVSKQAVRKIVDIGDFAGYVVRITNTSTTSIARNVILVDRIPFGFSYVSNSSVLDSARIADPTGIQELRWHLTDSLLPNSAQTFSYRLVVGAGGVEGTGVNTAQAFATTSTGHAIVSALVSERIEVQRGVFTDRGIIVGKVFYDDNHNAMQDEGEEGVKNVELMMEDGTRIITGDDGKYSLPDVPPGQHVIKVRQHTLPKGAVLLAGRGAFARDPSSRFVNLTESNIARVDFYLRRQVRETSVVGKPTKEHLPKDTTVAPIPSIPAEPGNQQKQ